MEVLIQTVVSGLIIGCVYGLIGLGFSLSYLTAGILNFAQGDLVGLGAYSTLSFYNLGLPLGLAVVAAAIVVGVAVGIVERIAFRPLYRLGPSYPTLSSFGLAIVIESMIQLAWGAQSRGIPSLLTQNTFSISGIKVSPEQVLAVALSLAVFAVVIWMLSRTQVGRGMRTLARDPEVAALVGVNRSRTLFLAFATAGAAAVVAAILVGPTQGLNPQMGLSLGIIGFTAAALGGFGSAGGALIGGIAVAIAENLVVVYVSPEYENAIAYGLLMLVLLVRPQGLLGESQVRARLV